MTAHKDEAAEHAKEESETLAPSFNREWIGVFPKVIAKVIAEAGREGGVWFGGHFCRPIQVEIVHVASPDFEPWQITGFIESQQSLIKVAKVCQWSSNHLRYSIEDKC